MNEIKNFIWRQLFPYFSNKQNSIFYQLEYWFSIYPDGFYKFLEPCDNRDYREMNSWSEEVKCHRTTFNRVFDTFGIRYKSKTTFLKSPDVFKGKMYASYYDRKEKKYFYLRNHEKVNVFLQAVNTKNHQKVLDVLSNTSKGVSTCL